jgi:hypothetical protein
VHGPPCTDSPSNSQQGTASSLTSPRLKHTDRTHAHPPSTATFQLTKVPSLQLPFNLCAHSASDTPKTSQNFQPTSALFPAAHCSGTRSHRSNSPETLPHTNSSLLQGVTAHTDPPPSSKKWAYLTVGLTLQQNAGAHGPVHTGTHNKSHRFPNTNQTGCHCSHPL